MPLVIVAALLMFLPARAAFADGCTALGGDVVGSECQVSASVSKSGAFNIDQQTFRILNGRKITVPVAKMGNTLEINVCAAGALTTCDFIMEAGAEITGDVQGTGTDTGVGATININATGRIELQGDGTNGALISSNQNAGSCTAGGRAGNINLVAGFDITTQAGSVISANGTPCPGGSIKLISAQGNVTTAGLISSVSTMSGTGAQQFPGGGPITIIARCKATVGGTVESRGGDAGADLVHVEAGCDVVIDGLVQSTGDGHAPPNAPGNHCFGPLHPDKPTTTTACIEIWSGGTLTVNPTAELNADTGGGGNLGTSWIDLFARGDILIDGDAAAPFAQLDGSWSGSGRINLTDGKSEGLKCRAYYTPKGSGAEIGVALRCASHYRSRRSAPTPVRSSPIVRSRISAIWFCEGFSKKGRISRPAVTFSATRTSAVSRAMNTSSWLTACHRPDGRC